MAIEQQSNNNPEYPKFSHRLNKLLTLKIIIPISIFLIAFIPRVIDLGTGLSADETIWIARSNAFIHNISALDPVQTYINAHPGITTSWLSGSFLTLFTNEGMNFPLQLAIGRFPIVLVTSLGILLMYFLLKKLFNDKVALFGAVFIALDPFYLAYCRYIRLDALLTTFMVLSLLFFFLFLKRPQKSVFLIFSGIFLGLSLLTKLPAFFLIPFFVFILIIWKLYDTVIVKKTPVNNIGLREILHSLNPILIIFSIGAVVFILLWPAMWVEPHIILSDILNMAERNFSNPHGSGFFMGEISDGNYGRLFYPVVILLKTTPFTLVFSLVSIVCLLYQVRNRKLSTYGIAIIFFILYILSFCIIMGSAEKEGGRYILPIFPILDILAAIGFYYCYCSIVGQLEKIKEKNQSFNLILFRNATFFSFFVVLFLFQLALLIPLAPNFVAYSNPVVFGGPEHVAEIYCTGTGEGLDLAAGYMNSKPDAENLVVACQYWQIFAWYFVGDTVSLDNKSSDYTIFYLSVLQRGFNLDIWNAYQNETPEKIIRLNSIDYCWIYPTHKTQNEWQIPALPAHSQVDTSLLNNDSVTTKIYWGKSTDIPVTGDWNGDGLWDVGIFRPSTHTFYLKNGTTTTRLSWGKSTDIPVTGDWNGDGLWDVGIFRPSTRTFYLKNGTTTTRLSWGKSTDIPVTGDWNGDGLWDVGMFRPSTHTFYLKNGSVTTIVNWSINPDIPITGDWNGDGRTEVGILLRPIY